MHAFSRNLLLIAALASFLLAGTGAHASPSARACYVKLKAMLSSAGTPDLAYSRLLKHVVEDLNGFSPEELRHLQNSPEPVNPLDLFEGRLDEIQKQVLKTTFDKTLKSITSEQWEKIRLEIETMTGKKAEQQTRRDDAAEETDRIWKTFREKTIAPYGYWEDTFQSRDGRTFHLFQETNSHKRWLVHEDGIKNIPLGGRERGNIGSFVAMTDGTIRVVYIDEKNLIQIVDENGRKIDSIVSPKPVQDEATILANEAADGSLNIFVKWNESFWRDRKMPGGYVSRSMHSKTYVRRYNTKAGVWEDLKIPIEDEFSLKTSRDGARVFAYQAGSDTDEVRVAEISGKPSLVFHAARPKDSPKNTSGGTADLMEIPGQAGFLVQEAGSSLARDKTLHFLDMADGSDFHFVPDKKNRESIENTLGPVVLADGRTVYAVDTWGNQRRFLVLIDPVRKQSERYDITSDKSDTNVHAVGIVNVKGNDYAIVYASIMPVKGLVAYSLNDGSKIDLQVQNLNPTEIKSVYSTRDGRVIALIEKASKAQAVQLFGRPK